MLDGGAGDDLLLARWGADTVSGGEGADRLSLSLEGSEATGGAGADHFNYFAPQAHGVLGEALITDLEDQDVIDLHRLDADSTTGGDQAFTLVGSLTGTAGEATLSYDAGSDQTSLLLDTDGDGSADITILMDGDHSSFSNFVL
jgi:serralysin